MASFGDAGADKDATESRDESLSHHAKEDDGESHRETSRTAASTVPVPEQSGQSSSRPETASADSVKSCEVRQAVPILGTGFGNIVDYPITPESSEEEEQMEGDTEDTGVKDQQQPVAQICQEDLTSPCEDTPAEPQALEKQDLKEDKVQEENSKTQAENPVELKEVSISEEVEESKNDEESKNVDKDISSGSTDNKQDSDDVTHPVVPEYVQSQSESPTTDTEQDTTEANMNILEEKESLHKPSAEGDSNNSAIILDQEQNDKANTEIQKTDVDDIETASQGSAEFQPDLGDTAAKDLHEATGSFANLRSESDDKTTDGDDFPKPKEDEVIESMDVDGEESNQDVDDAVGTPVGTPAGALDLDEAVGTPTASLDVEDGDSLLPDREVPGIVSKKGGFPITAAFMDENSLSLDCVLGISSTVPDGDVSMDMSIGSVASKECPTPAKRSRPGSVMSGVEADLDDDGNFPAENLFEYQWPLDGGEWFMLQEQLSEYLQIKSFKRKYPDLSRRTCDKNEKDFLRERGVVSETQCDLGLTALKSEEVYDLMHKDYQDRYREYAHVLHEKERQNINNKHKEYEVPKLDKGKMGAYIKKAVKAAADFNAQFQRERREERREYFDLQTFMIQYPAGRHKKVGPEATKPGAYPVSLIPGQFQNYYCRYTSDELKYLPLNTTVFDPPKKMSNTLVKPTSDQDSSEVEDSTEDKAESASDGESDGDGSSDSDGSDSDAEEETKSKEKEEVLAVPLVEEKCRICNSVEAPPPEKKVSRGKKVKQEKIATEDQEMIKCSECGTVGHPSCLDLTNAMVSVIRTYPWQCMECKTCVECMDPYDEDKMMFCDRCDRGYHTFCVGLRSIPTGRWECRSCKGTDTPRARKRTSLAK